MDSKSIGLCPQGFESPRRRICDLQKSVIANAFRKEVESFGEDADDVSIDRMSMGKCSHTGSNRGPLGYWPNALTN